jgi:hypothetical protein
MALKFMKEFFKNIKEDKLVSSAFYINIVLLVLTIICIIFFYVKLPPFVPVFNQLPWGDQRLGPTFTIFIPALTAILIFIINIFISAFIYKKIPLLSRMLAIISLLAGILTIIFIIRTITLII